jgi:hypothetical protein
MKGYKVSDVLKMLKMDGWYLYKRKAIASSSIRLKKEK